MVDILQRIRNGEDSYTQFKVNITNSEKLAQELVAFSNAKGGLLFIGIDDDGHCIGLSKEDIKRLNQLIGNVINSNVTPPIYPLVKIENIDDKTVLVLEIDEGANKPYSTNSGIYLTKAGSDKRKISPQELRRLFAESKNLYPDEDIVKNSTIEDIDVSRLKKFLKEDNAPILHKLNRNELDLSAVLTNLELLRDNHLTLAGNLLFGEDPQRFCPSFYIDCCYFDGNDVSVTKFISKSTLKGTFSEMFEDCIRFIVSQLRRYQVEEDFNSNGELEINREILTELIINALIHRDYYINSSIKVFLFHNRLEIISPGKLTNSLTVEKIKNGIAVQRNPILSSICKNLLPYTGYGSGIKRVLSFDSNIEFINDTDMEQFKSIVYRDEAFGLGESSQSVGENSESTKNVGEKLGESSQNVGEKLGESSQNVGENVELSEKRKYLLELLANNPEISIPILSDKIGITETSIERNLKFLRENGFIRRVGGAKGGHWEILF